MSLLPTTILCPHFLPIRNSHYHQTLHTPTHQNFNRCTYPPFRRFAPCADSAQRSARSSIEHSHLRPNSMDGSNGIHQLMSPSPSDMVGPSPVTSNGTETTEIEDEAADEVEELRPPPASKLSSSGDSQATVCATALKIIHVLMGYS